MKNNTRFSICLLFLWMSMSFCLAAETYSQETFFTIESNNLTVKEVFNKIEKESEYIFFYLDNSVDLNRKVSVKARKEQVSKILDQIFEGTDTHYYISDRQIIISESRAANFLYRFQHAGYAGGKQIIADDQTNGRHKSVG